MKAENFKQTKMQKQICRQFPETTEKVISSYLYKTSKEFHSDIVGFGRKLSKNYLTIKDFKALDWLNIYKNSFFEVDVTVHVRSSQLILKD